MLKKILPHLAVLPLAILTGLSLVFFYLWYGSGDWEYVSASFVSASYITLTALVSMLLGGLLAWRVLLFLPRPARDRLIYSLIVGLVLAIFLSLDTYSTSLNQPRDTLGRFLSLLFVSITAATYWLILPLARRSTLLVRAIIGLVFVGIPLFYAVENYRGSRAWEATKTFLLAKGETLDYDLMIPKPIPDADNILKAPGMEEWFVKANNRLPWSNYDSLIKTAHAIASSKHVMGTLRILVSSEPSTTDLKAKVSSLLLEAKARAGWSFKPLLTPLFPTNQPSAPKNSLRAIRYLSPVPLTSLPPLHVELKMDNPPTAAELNAALSLVAELPLRFEARATSESGTFDLVLASTEVVSAADYLAWSDSLQSSFDLILQASTRKAAYLHGHYHPPQDAPISRFIATRSLSRVVSDGLQAHLLLGDSQQALKDIELLHATRRTIASPDFVIISAMMTATVAEFEYEGIREAMGLHQWSGEQLSALQARVEKDNLTSNLLGAVRMQRAMFIRDVERHFTQDSFGYDSTSNLMIRFIYWGPNGWRMNNMALHSGLMQTPIEVLTSTSPKKPSAVLEKLEREFEQEFRSITPSNALAAMASPSYGHVIRRVFRAQTQAHLAVLACALERHRLETGTYTEKLESLVPKYLSKLPIQVVNGDPFLYRLETDGGYSIWSVGWDLKDDGGKFEVGDRVDEAKSDWGWHMKKP